MPRPIIPALLVSLLTTALGAADTPATWCNPLPLPDYPVGKLARAVRLDARKADGGLWLNGVQEPYRELADPSALWHDGAWYLYPSVDMAWVSRDQGATWRHQPLNIRDVGYAPTVVRHRDRFLLLASGSELYTADQPLGPFHALGRIAFPKDRKLPGHVDPMLFADDDGRLYHYWGCTPQGGIWGVELDTADPLRVIGEPKELIPFEPDRFPWQRVGDWNQNPRVGWMEGGWMVKRNGTYHLTYSAGGTENRTYAMGCATGPSPLGPFTAQARNPILRTVDGLVTGSAHGCIVKGPADQWWTFYTIRAGVVHGFERRLGMDRAVFDAEGNLFIGEATSSPQWLPGRGDGASPGWLPITGGMPVHASSAVAGLAGRQAVDDDLRTWWQPAADDAEPRLECRINFTATIHAVRVVWRDVGLDPLNGVAPGPFRWRAEIETAKNQWTVLVDRTANADDLLIDYRECAPTTSGRIRLVVTGWPKGITPGVAEFTAFGTAAR